MTDLVYNTHGYMPHQATSPAATGDRGGSFEQHVAASFLAYLLTRGIPLLNACVKMGSSVCYRQRDDFITPTAPGGAIVQA